MNLPKPPCSLATARMNRALSWMAMTFCRLRMMRGFWLNRSICSGLSSTILSGGLLTAAGIYQLTPLKDVCLSHCRSPADFLSRHWRKGRRGALRMGIEHGLYCVGCCWFLMALLFAGGVMNLLWIAGLAVLVLVEKLTRYGRAVSRITGILLIGAGVWLIAGFGF